MVVQMRAHGSVAWPARGCCSMAGAPHHRATNAGPGGRSPGRRTLSRIRRTRVGSLADSHTTQRPAAPPHCRSREPLPMPALSLEKSPAGPPPIDGEGPGGQIQKYPTAVLGIDVTSEAAPLVPAHGRKSRSRCRASADGDGLAPASPHTRQRSQHQEGATLQRSAVEATFPTGRGSRYRRMDGTVGVEPRVGHGPRARSSGKADQSEEAMARTLRPQGNFARALSLSLT